MVMDFDFSFGSFLYFIDWLGFGSDSSSDTLEGNHLGTGAIGG